MMIKKMGMMLVSALATISLNAGDIYGEDSSYKGEVEDDQFFIAYAEDQ